MKAFDVSPIIDNFYRDILENDRRANWEAYALLVFPAMLSLVAFLRPIDSEFVSMMATALAILFGFTFSSLLTTAKYSAKGDRIEEKVVKQARLGTSYALLVNLVALISIVAVSIAVVDYATLPSLAAIATSVVVYFLLFHYLLVMIYLMRYLYVLAIGGALEQGGGYEREQRDEPPQQKVR